MPSKRVTASPVPVSIASPQVTLAHYKDSRFWGIWIDGELLVITVYRKGARAVLEKLGLNGRAVELKRPRLEGRWRREY